MKKTFSINPLVKIILSFALLIFAGAFILTLPFSVSSDISFIDALFTSVSAVCVTGLIVVDTATKFTEFGQGIILALIQMGGLGIMTISVTLFFFLGGKLSVRWQYTFMDIYSTSEKLHINMILKRVLMYTFTVELLGAILLFPQFLQHHAKAGRAAWEAVFHSISAFCNAGFSTYSDNLIGFNSNPVLLILISANIIIGGIGFYVISDILSAIKHLYRKKFNREKKLYRLSLQTKIVLAATAILIFSGTAITLFLEYSNTLNAMSMTDKIANALFQSVTCRTAGFNSIDIGSQKETTQFFQIALMFIGGSPGSIAGGIKTTTLWIIAAMILSKFKGTNSVAIWKRKIDGENVEKATTLALLALIFISCATFMLMHTDVFHVRNVFLSSFYEMTSAFGTVGLSTGITPQMSTTGKIITCIVMFVGRLGPLTLFASFTFNKKVAKIDYPKENIMVG